MNTVKLIFFYDDDDHDGVKCTIPNWLCALVCLSCVTKQKEKSQFTSHLIIIFPVSQYIILLCPSALKGFKIILEFHALAHTSHPLHGF